MSGRAELALGLEEMHRDFVVGVEPVKLESTARCIAVVVAHPAAPGRGGRPECGTADDPGIAHRLIIRADDSAGNSRTAAQHHANLRALGVWFQFTGDEGMSIEGNAAGLAVGEFPIADLGHDVIFTPGLNSQIASTRRRR